MYPSVDPTAQAHCQAVDARVRKLEGELAENVGLLNATHGRLVELVAQALDEDLWSGWGIHSPAHWLAWQAGMAPLRAAQIVKLAERSRDLPNATAALSDGALSVDQATEIARHVPGQFDESVTDLAKGSTVTQLRRTLPRYDFEDQLDDEAIARGADTDPAGDTDPADSTDPDDDADTRSDGETADGAPAPAGKPIAERRELSCGVDDDGSWWLHVRAPIDEGARIEAAIRAGREDLYRQACEPLDDTDPRPVVSLLDGLLGVAETAMHAAETAHPGSDRYLVYAHLEAGPGADTKGVLSLHLGPILPDYLRRLHTCDATLRPVLERDGTPVNVGRDERIVPRRIRRLIEHRDRGCAVPGCERRHALQVHHIIHWEDSGPTDTHNLVCVCATHHRLHHRNLLGITGNADRRGEPGGLEFRDRWGRLLDPAGTPINPTPERPLRDTGRSLGIDPAPYVRPFGERLDTSMVFFTTNPPPDARPEPDLETEPPPEVPRPPRERVAETTPVQPDVATRRPHPAPDQSPRRLIGGPSGRVARGPDGRQRLRHRG